ncbi:MULTISPECIES: hypothetical protein [unclassified Sphingomonas]|uniref:hypothetical protein n=1 Tax=unclassified Sphingomonas TaxID=196159 RepID=UPI00226AC16B|nr:MULTISPECIES: hypothetical protein [unclassified Sphingomonas]
MSAGIGMAFNRLLKRPGFSDKDGVVAIVVGEFALKPYLFVGIDRTSKFAVMQLVDKADRRTAWEFL